MVWDGMGWVGLGSEGRADMWITSREGQHRARSGGVRAVAGRRARVG